MNSTSGLRDAVARPDSFAARSRRGWPGFPPWPRAAADASRTGGSITENVTEPLATVGDSARALPGQIARFGELAGRDLSARASAALPRTTSR